MTNVTDLDTQLVGPASRQVGANAANKFSVCVAITVRKRLVRDVVRKRLRPTAWAEQQEKLRSWQQQQQQQQQQQPPLTMFFDNDDDDNNDHEDDSDE